MQQDNDFESRTTSESPSLLGVEELDWDTDDLGSFFLDSDEDLEDPLLETGIREGGAGPVLGAFPKLPEPEKSNPVPHLATPRPLGPTLLQAQALNFPKLLVKLFNEGDLDKMRSVINEHVMEEATLKTPSTKGAVPNARQRLFDFYNVLLENHPDGVLSFEKSVLDRASGVICKGVFTGTDIGTFDLTPTGDKLLYCSQEECRTVGVVLKQLLKGLHRKFFPASVKSRLLKMEREVRQGKAKGVREIHFVVLFKEKKNRKDDGSPYISRIEMKWTLRDFKTVKI